MAAAGDNSDSWNRHRSNWWVRDCEVRRGVADVPQSIPRINGRRSIFMKRAERCTPRQRQSSISWEAWYIRGCVSAPRYIRIEVGDRKLRAAQWPVAHPRTPFPLRPDEDDDDDVYIRRDVLSTPLSLRVPAAECRRGRCMRAKRY